ncbi:MAG: amidophosphoribosyltransferase [Thermoplasmata archaeon]|nr:amidophosphoribosyltransferase [Thermoplasmata archaeon]
MWHVPKIREACGVIGMCSPGSVSDYLYFGLRILQHRGQESAGISVFEDGKHTIVKGMGLVHQVMDKDRLGHLKSNKGIGHVRYSTFGVSALQNVQPFVVQTTHGEVSLGHNGEIINAEALRTDLKKKGWAFMTSSDSEIIVRLLANELSTHGDPVKAIKNLMGIIVGSYSLVVMIGDRVFGVRDPYAIRPLCLGRLNDGWAVASESVVFDNLDGEFVRDVEGGEIVEVACDGPKSWKYPSPKEKAHCMFEWVYFARPDSIIEGGLVYEVRKRIGSKLAKEHPVDADVVIPIPDSGRAHALGFSEVSGIPYREGLMKNRYVERTFIMPDQRERETGVMLKLNAIKSEVIDKKVVLLDDSIIRGTTMKQIVQILRKAGAKEIHVRIGSPPVTAPCYLGIDMKTRHQFVALNRTVEEIANVITADSIGYLSLNGLIECIGVGDNNLCIGCLTGEYPIPIEGERVRFQKKIDAF